MIPDKICKKCGCKVFYANETITHVIKGGEIVNSFGGNGMLHTFNCVRCTDGKGREKAILTSMERG